MQLRIVTHQHQHAERSFLSSTDDEHGRRGKQAQLSKNDYARRVSIHIPCGLYRSVLRDNVRRFRNQIENTLENQIT